MTGSIGLMLAKDAGVEREPPGNRTLNLLIKRYRRYVPESEKK